MNPDEIKIREKLKPGDIGMITYLHGKLYSTEYNYDYHFESYVAEGLHEFAEKYNPEKDCLWICEHRDKIIGSIFLVSRNESAQLRYFFLLPEYRGRGLGKKLMNLFCSSLKERGYKKSFLWTTKELAAAANLYTRFGFILVEEKTHFLWGKEITEQKYELVINDKSM